MENISEKLLEQQIEEQESEMTEERAKYETEEQVSSAVEEMPEYQIGEQLEMQIDAPEGNYESILEAILFTMGESVEVSRLAAVLELDVRKTRKILQQMQEKYLQQDRGIMLTWLEDAVQLCTKPQMYEHLIKIAKTPRKITLTETVLETLSIVAYKQPVTRVEIERIRGVSCDHAINKLMEYDLICELGRLDAPGRPLLFGTTEQFLRCFGVSSIEELPQINPMQMEEFKQQAEAEVGLQV